MNRNTCRKKLVSPLAIVALAPGVLTPSASVADEVTDWNQILTSALTGRGLLLRHSD